MSEAIKIGDRVRSYDFAHRRDCYVEGVVQGLKHHCGCDRYEILVDYVVWGGQPEPAPNDHVVLPPMNGTPTLGGDVTAFVEKL